MDNENERILARRIYNEEARLRGFRQNLNTLRNLFDSVSRVDCDLLGASLVAEHWIKSVVTSEYVIYRRADEEDDLTELVLPRVKNEFYEAQILATGWRYADSHQTSLADVLERWTKEARSNASAPNLSSYLKEPDYFGTAYDPAKEAPNATVATF